MGCYVQCFVSVLFFYGLLFTVPVKLQDDGPVHDGKAQQANPPQEDTSKHTGIEVQDHHLQRCTAELTFTHLINTS